MELNHFPGDVCVTMVTRRLVSTVTGCAWLEGIKCSQELSLHSKEPTCLEEHLLHPTEKLLGEQKFRGQNGLGLHPNHAQ